MRVPPLPSFPQRLFIRRPNALKEFIPNFGIVLRHIQNRCVLLNRETLFGHGLCKLIVGFRHDTLLLSGCFRFSDTLPVVILETCNAFDRSCHCTKLLIRQVGCGGRRAGVIEPKRSLLKDNIPLLRSLRQVIV